VAAAACRHAREPARVPRVVALVVIDQLGEASFEPKAAAATDGVARALHGRRFIARYPYAATSTAPGHATFGTGAPPAVNGIIGNEFWDRDRDEIADATRGAKGVQSSARLRVDGIADMLLRAHADAHAVAVALKPRSALLSLGHRGLAVWYDADAMRMIANGPAPWLDELAAAHPLADLVHATWQPIDPVLLAKLSGQPDDAPGELAVPGWTASFPHRIADAKIPHKAIESTPFANDAVADAAIAAIAGEHLGDDDTPDLLIVSFSAYDYIGHAFGPDSWESWDAWLRLDAQIGAIERALDDACGTDGWTMILTSDHGAPGTPARRHAQGLPGQALAFEDVADAAERGAETVAGAPPAKGSWIAASRYPTVWLSKDALASPLRDKLLDAAVAAVAALPGIARAARSDALAGHCDTRIGDDRAICLSLDPERSGEIVYLPTEGTIFAKRSDPDATDHGSTYDYDRDVPLLIVGHGVVPSGTQPPPRARVSPLAIAPTLAALLGVSPPPAARERPLPLL
jgi:hypothetical protein